MKPDIAIADKDRESVGKILDALLSDENILAAKTRNYHWNVVGPHFNDLHKFLESQYEDLAEVVDDVAERSRALGRPSLGTLAEFLKHARLSERPGERLDGPGMLASLLKDHEAVIRSLREDLETCGKRGDMGTNDFLTGLLERHEKMAWMLRSFLE